MENDNDIILNLINYERVVLLVASLLLNLLIVSAIVIPKFILKHKKEFASSLYLFNFVVFVLCYVMNKTEISFGTGIGLFAVFTMLRFRSEMLNLPDMTYLLVIISIGFVNAAFNSSVSFVEILLLNIALCIMIYVLDYALSQTKFKCKKIKYGNLELIKPEKHNELVNDLVTITGLDVSKVRIDSINLNEENANIMIFYKEHDFPNTPVNNNIPFFNKFKSFLFRNHLLEKQC